ncbi:MAG: hypothetical protein ACRCU1_18970 [Alsobacter sp.]
MIDIESGWLIEIPGDHQRPLWWTGGGWTADADSAVRYARKVDAERVILHSGHEGAEAVEHQWVPAKLPPKVPRTETVASPAPGDICASCGRRGDDHQVRHAFTRMLAAPPATPSWRAG